MYILLGKGVYEWIVFELSKESYSERLEDICIPLTYYASKTISSIDIVHDELF